MAEKEYIEREEVREAFRMEFDNDYADGITDKLPTANVQEVRHGKNITKIKPVDEFECSECGFICEICENIYYDDCICHREYNPEFCPNCGAKMDKE